MDEMGALSYRVWYFASLHYDEDQRNNEINARRQQVQILFARQQQASSWFNPELLAIPLDTIRGWMDANDGLAVYRFAIESLFHEQEHVLDERGERLLSFAGRFNSVPYDSYAALTTADMKFPDDHAGDGRAGDADLRAVPGAARDQPPAGGSRRRLSRVPPDLRRQPEHLRRALQRRAAARLVSRPRPRLRDARSTRRCTATTSRPRSSRT